MLRGFQKGGKGWIDVRCKERCRGWIHLHSYFHFLFFGRGMVGCSLRPFYLGSFGYKSKIQNFLFRLDSIDQRRKELEGFFFLKKQNKKRNMEDQ